MLLCKGLSITCSALIFPNFFNFSFVVIFLFSCKQKPL